MFDIDFDKLIGWLLPAALRRTIYYAWVKALCSPMVSMYGTFTAWRNANLYQIRHDSRVFSMQAVFNDAFDKINRRIYITDGYNKNRIYLYTRTEAQPVFLNPSIPLWNRGDYSDTGVDFIVWVPTAITMTVTDMIQLTGLVNKYKLASKRYAIYRV
jgi:hypothetical protein